MEAAQHNIRHRAPSLFNSHNINTLRRAGKAFDIKSKNIKSSETTPPQLAPSQGRLNQKADEENKSKISQDK